MLTDFRLKVFYLCAVQKNFTKTARMLGITQPAVSIHISELESNIGAPLFLRNRNEVSLTEKGRILFTYVEKILGTYECLNRELFPVSPENISTLRIAAEPSAARYLLPEIAGYFMKLYPEIRITILERQNEELEYLLQEKEADLAIGTVPGSSVASTIFATTAIRDAAAPMRTYYMMRNEDCAVKDHIEKFINTCRTF